LPDLVPLEPQSADLVVSPLALHLTNDTPGVLVQLRRSLKPDGLLLAATRREREPWVNCESTARRRK
jgi:ubiquinone/menaquinone biosynthesis C-methylase UbiE